MNQLLILATTVALLNTGTAQAQDNVKPLHVAIMGSRSSAVETQAVPHHPNDLSLLETAIGKQTKASEKVSFVLRYDSDFTNAHFTVRYDPEVADDAWTVIDQPDQELSDEDLTSMIEAVSSTDAQHVFGGFDPDFFASIDSPVEVIESEGAISHDFQLPAGQLINRGEPLDAGDAIRMTITVDRAAGLIMRMRTYAVKPFKPNKVAKVTKFEQDLHFIALPGADVSVLKQRRENIVIRAFFFKKMVEDWQYSDYEVVE